VPHDGALNPRCTVLRLRPQLPSSVAPQAQRHPGGSRYVPSMYFYLCVVRCGALHKSCENYTL